MRVALIQLSMGGESHAQDLQHLSAAIDRAGSTSPAPDLIALPGQCDIGGARSARGITDAFLECARENLASKAKEWGVFIAAGLHSRVGGKLVPYAILFDSDGDTVARSGSAFPATSSIGLWSSPIGVLGVLEPTLRLCEEDPRTQLRRGALVVLPLAATMSKTRRRALDEVLSCVCDNAPGTGDVYAAVVSPARETDGSADTPVTLIRGRGGKTLACVKDASEATALAEIALTTTETG